ncbi:YecA family protein [Roseicyclus sp.]|uniref:YecA/YgfB family protein n=1 Tax=Roseicyclus sp. TaxID=1914329 RepID=UPI001BCF2582|nr:YecA family protein [Roseicyclus sp.]
MSDEIDLEGLDTYLMSDDSPENCMMLSDLDGFLHGIVCSPVEIPKQEWLRKAMGGPFNKVPPAILETITDIYDNIVDGLALEEPEVEPIFWEAKEGHVIAMDWCEGFMDAVALRPKEWLRLTESGTSGHLMTPILCHLIDENGNSVMGIRREDLFDALGQAAEDIPTAVVGIHQFWKLP